VSLFFPPPPPQHLLFMLLISTVHLPFSFFSTLSSLNFPCLPFNILFFFSSFSPLFLFSFVILLIPYLIWYPFLFLFLYFCISFSTSAFHNVLFLLVLQTPQFCVLRSDRGVYKHVQTRFLSMFLTEIVIFLRWKLLNRSYCFTLKPILDEWFAFPNGYLRFTTLLTRGRVRAHARTHTHTPFGTCCLAQLIGVGFQAEN
jgi:hypothetical protein